MSVISLIAELCSRDVAAMDCAELNADCSSLAAVQSWVDARKVAQSRRFQQLAVLAPAIEPEADMATAARGGRRDAETAARRAGTLDAVPEFEDALVHGEVSGAHVDALSRTMARLDQSERAGLTAHGELLREMASTATPEQFQSELNRMVRGLQSDGGVALLERQKRDTRLRLWRDRDSGMYRLAGELDPETGLLLRGRLENAVDALFHDRTPDTCPGDPKEKQDHLRALALVALTAGRSVDKHEPEDITLIGRNTEISVVIDFDTLLNGLSEHSLIDHGDDGTWLPMNTYWRMACSADIVPVVLNSDGVALRVGRSKRVANRDRRRALRAMYATCGVPGCTVRSRHCEPHHIHWWRNGGVTDIENLIPLCSKHHHAVHEGGWKLLLHSDRSLTITYPDGTIRSTGPPGTQRAA